ncbi:hypothetical protein Sru01_04990 [Sphaerisporangium rufum]|uniref:Uncharacterized protein n=1 Tax=Sphaerisporangium rufum TaxID=1381558 RepID=A0A919R214_9ACTN|nr:hypothetical protein [Sphaerisporangium rufum]GII75517.1 hypothetical protein Sru01_04990 [Sphaerisporangium rufum]
MAEVPNPLYTYLTQLRQRVHEVQDKLGKKLDKPTNSMAGKKVWTSPTADAWGGRLSDQRRAYNDALAGLDDELSGMLARTPKTCSPAEAKMLRMDLQGR